MLFVNPFPDPVELTQTIRGIWKEARTKLSCTACPDPSRGSKDQVCHESALLLTKIYTVLTVFGLQMCFKHSSVRSQYVFCAKENIKTLYGLNIDDPPACARKVAYLLEEDRFNCAPKGYDVGVLKAIVSNDFGL